MTILLNVTDQDRLDAFHEVFARELPDIAVVTSEMAYPREDIRYVFTWRPLDDWSSLHNLEIVFSVSAGIDQFDALPEHIKLVKMVDPNNTQKVVDYVLAACLSCMRDFPKYADRQRQKTWIADPSGTTTETTVTILGLGEIGEKAARTLASVGFSVTGWARSPRAIEGVTCKTGKDGLDSLLADADIVVCLLPLTDETRGLLSRRFFDRMKPGASLVHTGRGAQCVFPDLADALESGQLGNAIVDVFETEPLPPTDPIWEIPNLLITPHIAGRTDAQTSAQNVSMNLKRLRDGKNLLWCVDRSKGY
ncbi:glyoxylate/hydroxypyruvate reductase A [Celeribacter sp. PS-C1]|uniref:2-hydroxyacid dehydrogenase n=1 Tax=Celeribacter sp. PS-C1 TaxID=2820813 RepID=UPI001CA4CD13|nr:glyoxylate/hydroxypyruvate reductase A [Celeribacter sp. PS-C1]MBW6418551.1 glyoxylate/hydroxypyruvate reductase A [Celeribacter sp. PS-C1]